MCYPTIHTCQTCGRDYEREVIGGDWDADRVCPDCLRAGEGHPEVMTDRLEYDGYMEQARRRDEDFRREYAERMGRDYEPRCSDHGMDYDSDDERPHPVDGDCPF